MTGPSKPVATPSSGSARWTFCAGDGRTLDKLDQETGAWERWANRQRLRIRWRFTVPKARAKFGYNSPIFSRSEDWSLGIAGHAPAVSGTTLNDL